MAAVDAAMQYGVAWLHRQRMERLVAEIVGAAGPDQLLADFERPGLAVGVTER